MASRSPPEYQFDFDAWQTLARLDPAGFERRRRELLEALIRHSPSEKRLRCLQFRIDLERRRSPVPLKTCLYISARMWDSFHELRCALERMAAVCSVESAPLPAAEKKPGQILPFRR